MKFLIGMIILGFLEKLFNKGNETGIEMERDVGGSTGLVRHPAEFELRWE